MPCGGIFPMKGPGSVTEKRNAVRGGCWVCGYGGCMHFCSEWDTYIHARCVADFLKTDEGACIISHGHEVHLDFSCEKENKNEKADRT